MILVEILCDVSILHMFKNLFINQDYIHCGSPINSLIKSKLYSLFCKKKKKYINSVKWSLFKGVDLILEAQCQDDNLKKKPKTTRKTTTNDENYVNFSINILLVR